MIVCALRSETVDNKCWKENEYNLRAISRFRRQAKIPQVLSTSKRSFELNLPALLISRLKKNPANLFTFLVLVWFLVNFVSTSGT